VLADDCNPTFGDQIRSWVDAKASNLSQNLAEADYRARILNYFLISPHPEFRKSRVRARDEADADGRTHQANTP
jgi:hypothetical protein